MSLSSPPIVELERPWYRFKTRDGNYAIVNLDQDSVHFDTHNDQVWMQVMGHCFALQAALEDVERVLIDVAS